MVLAPRFLEVANPPIVENRQPVVVFVGEDFKLVVVVRFITLFKRLISLLDVKRAVRGIVDHPLLFLVVYDSEYFLVAQVAELHALPKKALLAFEECLAALVFVIYLLREIDLILPHSKVLIY